MEKIRKLADLLLDYSTKVQSGEKLVIDASIEAKPLVNEIIKGATKRGVYVKLRINDDDFSQNLIKNNAASINHFEFDQGLLDNAFESMDAYISVRATKNDFSSKEVTVEEMNAYNTVTRKAINTRLTKKWVVLRWPTHGYAQKAEMNYNDYVEFCMNSMVNDYEKMTHDLEPLKQLMDQTSNVRIVGPETNLTFSIKDVPTVICSGLRNIPDGEVYTAPVIDSVNGVVKYNTYSMQNGKKWENVKLTFENGKIIDATCTNNDDAELMSIFNVDNGAKYVGEFSLGVNKNINKPIGDILYDEKIGGSFHFTPGSAYEQADNTNRSALHWDLVCIQNEEFGGGEIYFDDVLIRKDGKFIPEELKILN